MTTSTPITMDCPSGTFTGERLGIPTTVIKYVGRVDIPGGIVFEGEVYENGNPKEGVMTFPDGGRFEGTYPRNRWTDVDVGTMYYSNGDVYRGTFRQGARCNGTMEYADGRPADRVLNCVFVRTHTVIPICN